MNHRFLSTFLADESGVVTVEVVLWFAGLVGLATMLGQTVFVPLWQHAQAQAALNAQTIDLLQQVAACTGGTNL